MLRGRIFTWRGMAYRGWQACFIGRAVKDDRFTPIRLLQHPLTYRNVYSCGIEDYDNAMQRRNELSSIGYTAWTEPIPA